MVLPRSFYERPTLEVARALLGMVLVHGERRGRIVEVEAYPPGDPAAHSYRGRTRRTEVLYGPAGHAYVYVSYGIHNCFNVACEPEGTPGCVLIRGLDFVSGPGRLTRAMGIARAHSGRDLTCGDLRIERGAAPARVEATPRIGITKAADRRWRFVAR
jgi:DNA-3-methyladenine glycosylase